MKRRRHRENGRGLRWAYRIFAGWYFIWFLVGLGFVGFNLSPLFGPIEDFLFIFLAAMVLLLDASRRLGWPVALICFGWVALVAGLVETVGALTGFPFGSYYYTAAFGPRLGEVLPLAIPLAWWVIVLPLQIAFIRLSERNWLPLWAVPPAVGFAAVLVDLALEPVATLERGYWIWTMGGGWYGVPWTNFVGWFGTGVILSAGLIKILGSTLRRGYGWETPSAHVVPQLVLFSILATFLLASLVAGYYLAALLALLGCAGLVCALRDGGVFRLRTVTGSE